MNFWPLGQDFDFFATPTIIRTKMAWLNGKLPPPNGLMLFPGATAFKPAKFGIAIATEFPRL
ncbi:hypothetical protein QA641_36640 [Bradyrhizobium sp. CB1650]|uniref:hypothetical protein n=1 Tax=Bradyrhizobium sp. CB1650 TaxID=3039153 RepID=UPI0024357AA7|nr:hypothetical protein [Bradyrhizobium sp. CB1650]WGD51041.1 hypothetical protein QA641_36640 [Bradyrhizobium sp. CB1650]